MPNFSISLQDLISTHYGVLGATPADDASKIKAKYLQRIIHINPQHPDRVQFESAYAVLSSPQERERYDEELYRKTLVNKNLLTDAELAEFTNVVSIMLRAVAPHKAHLLPKSVGSGMYAIGDFFPPTGIAVVDPLEVLTVKEQDKFKALFKVLAKSHGGTIADIENSGFVIFKDKVLQSQFGQELFSAQQVREFIRYLKRDGQYVPLEEIAEHFHKVEQVSNLFNYNSRSELGYEMKHGLLYMLDDVSSDAEKIHGFLAPRLQESLTSGSVAPDEELMGWFGRGVRIEEVKKQEGHAPSQKTVRIIPKDSLEIIYANKQVEIAEMNRGNSATLTKQQAISRFYRAIQNNDKDRIFAGIEEMKIAGIDLTSLNRDVDLSPILYAFRYGADKDTLNLMLAATLPNFVQQPFGSAIIAEILARAPLFVMSDHLGNEYLRSAAEQNPAEYEAEKLILLQMKELSDHHYFPTAILFNSLNNRGIEFLISEERDAAKKSEMEMIYSAIRLGHHLEAVPAPVQHADAAAVAHENAAMDVDTPSQAVKANGAAQAARGRDGAARGGDKN